MVSQKPNLFRQESLERLSSPERLDQLMRVVAPKDWLGLGVLLGIAGLGLGWSVLGRIPVTVEARGVLIYPYRVQEVQVSVTGRLQVLKVKVGDRVQKGQVIGLLEQPELQEQLREQQLKLAELQNQDRQVAGLTSERSTLDRAVLQQQQQAIQQRLQTLQEFDPLLLQQQLRAIQAQRSATQQRLQNVKELDPVLRERLEGRQQLRREGAISGDSVLAADQEYRNNLKEIADLQVTLIDLDRQIVAAEQMFQTNQSQVAELQSQLQDLNRQLIIAGRQDLESANDRRNQIQATQQQIIQLQQRLKQDREIISPQAGQVLEVAAQTGQVLPQGNKILTLEATSTDHPLVSLNYFTIRDGKQIRPGQIAQITPDTVRREQFGGMLGTVRSVSAFPVTRQGVLSAVGNAEVADSLLVNGGQIEVLVKLQPDPGSPSGYRWSSSRGPNLTFSSGTPASIRVTVRQEPPINFILPFLRELTGLS